MGQATAQSVTCNYNQNLLATRREGDYMARKIIQIACSQSESPTGGDARCTLYALCDDGTLWELAAGVSAFPFGLMPETEFNWCLIKQPPQDVIEPPKPPK